MTRGDRQQAIGKEKASNIAASETWADDSDGIAAGLLLIAYCLLPIAQLPIATLEPLTNSLRTRLLRQREETV